MTYYPADSIELIWMTKAAPRAGWKIKHGGSSQRNDKIFTNPVYFANSCNDKISFMYDSFIASLSPL